MVKVNILVRNSDMSEMEQNMQAVTPVIKKLCEENKWRMIVPDDTNIFYLDVKKERDMQKAVHLVREQCVQALGATSKLLEVTTSLDLQPKDTDMRVQQPPSISPLLLRSKMIASAKRIRRKKSRLAE